MRGSTRVTTPSGWSCSALVVGVLLCLPNFAAARAADPPAATRPSADFTAADYEVEGYDDIGLHVPIKDPGTGKMLRSVKVYRKQGAPNEYVVRPLPTLARAASRKPGFPDIV